MLTKKTKKILCKKLCFFFYIVKRTSLLHVRQNQRKTLFAMYKSIKKKFQILFISLKYLDERNQNIKKKKIDQVLKCSLK